MSEIQPITDEQIKELKHLYTSAPNAHTGKLEFGDDGEVVLVKGRNAFVFGDDDLVYLDMARRLVPQLIARIESAPAPDKTCPNCGLPVSGNRCYFCDPKASAPDTERAKVGEALIDDVVSAATDLLNYDSKANIPFTDIPIKLRLRNALLRYHATHSLRGIAEAGR